MAEQTHQHFIERFTAIFNQPDVNIANEIFAPGFKSHLPLAPEVDTEGWKAYVQNFRGGFPDMRMDVHETVVTDDRLIWRVTYRGTHTADFMGVPASGKPIEMPAIGWFHMNADGLAVENWASFDVFTVMQAIGAIPAPA